jgi:hypothetical protein
MFSRSIRWRCLGIAQLVEPLLLIRFPAESFVVPQPEVVAVFFLLPNAPVRVVVPPQVVAVQSVFVPQQFAHFQAFRLPGVFALPIFHFQFFVVQPTAVVPFSFPRPNVPAPGVVLLQSVLLQPFFALLLFVPLSSALNFNATLFYPFPLNPLSSANLNCLAFCFCQTLLLLTLLFCFNALASGFALSQLRSCPS